MKCTITENSWGGDTAKMKSLVQRLEDKFVDYTRK